jgi:hypothetical protein
VIVTDWRNLVGRSPDASREQDHRQSERRHLQDDLGDTDGRRLFGKLKPDYE